MKNIRFIHKLFFFCLLLFVPYWNYALESQDSNKQLLTKERSKALLAEEIERLSPSSQ